MGNYTSELLKESKARGLVKLLKEMAYEHVFSNDEVITCALFQKYILFG